MEMFGLEKIYSTKNLYIGRIDNINENEIFKGPYVKENLKFYEMLPSKRKCMFVFVIKN